MSLQEGRIRELEAEVERLLYLLREIRAQQKEDYDRATKAEAEVAQLREQLKNPTCADCGVEIPKGQEIGKSGDDWPDKSKPRPVAITPFCLKCLGKRMTQWG